MKHIPLTTPNNRMKENNTRDMIKLNYLNIKCHCHQPIGDSSYEYM